MNTETEGGDGGVDRISCLHDDLLHNILLRLPDIETAARTSVLSRRWRRVWAYLPQLYFRYRYQGGGRLFPDREQRRVDAALAALSAQSGAAVTLTLLEVAMLFWDLRSAGPMGHVAAAQAFLRFASQRVAGELRLSLRGRGCYCCYGYGGVLTPCERPTAITLNIHGRPLRLQMLPAAGMFTALATLRIKKACVNWRELGDALFSRCPRLKELFLKQVTLGGEPDDHGVLSIRSDSLERLEIDVNAYVHLHLQLQVVAPRQRSVSPRISSDAHIVAPKLQEVSWYGPYDPDRHLFREAGRHLMWLEIRTNSPPAMLMRRFDSVHELQLTVKIGKGIKKCQEYLAHVNKLSECEVLVLTFIAIEHPIKPAILHLLKKCSGVKKIVVCSLAWRKVECQCKSWECQCDWSERSHKTQNIALDSLEQVEIKEHIEAYQKVEFVRLLCQYSATFQKRVTITIIENKRIEYIQEKI